MEKRLFIYIVLVLLFSAGCEEYIIETPDFNVTVMDSIDVVAKVGQPVTFKFAGNPDIIYFYSGEIGKRYDYTERASSAGTPSLQFTTLREKGVQEGSLQLLVSQDFPGITVNQDSITKLNIVSSNWTDITERATLSTGTNTNSGIVDLTDFATNKPVFIAFKYLAWAGSIQNKWTISSLLVKNTLSDGTVYTLANTTSAAINNYGVSTIYSPGWVYYNISGIYNWWLSSNKIIIAGASSATSATDSAEAWAIMGPLDLRKVSPDVATYIKKMDERIESYDYTYKTAGEYTASFVGSINNIYGKNEVVKQIRIKVNP